ncbi:G-patch domain-containing protein [Colletotrichum camelliae]|nr:G-patch domain-containing protein [Colletotrichum camelliae]
MAAPPPPPPPARGGLSLYANLLDPAADSSSATISSAPVRYNQDASSGDAKDETAAKKLIDPSLRFQPIRRPQVKSSKPAKPTFPKQIPGAAPSSTTATSTAATATGAPAPPPKTTLADWTATTEDDDFRYGGPPDRSHQRGGRRKKKKKNHDQYAQTNWDDIYDPSKPTNVEEYLRSDERIREVQEWKRLLYRHRRGRSVSDDSDEEDVRPATNQFAPPAEYSFVPPPPASPPPPPATSAAAPPPDDATGDDAYARRLALSSSNPPPPPPPADGEATISRAPVRYTREPSRSASASPPPTLGLGASSNTAASAAAADEDADDAPRSNRPGQAGFAQRLMSKYGWTKGSGLGVDEGGIVNPLRVQVEKRKKKSDAEGGGWADPANRAKILGGKRKDAEGEGGGKFGGPMSEVIVLQHMLDNMEDLQGEIANGLGQEIGEECGEKYGRVERLYIDVENRQVFIRFTDQVSALRAVNELDGRIFNGNTVIPKFYDTAKFERGIYR